MAVWPVLSQRLSRARVVLWKRAYLHFNARPSDLYASYADVDDRLDRVAVYSGDDVELILAGAQVFYRENFKLFRGGL